MFESYEKYKHVDERLFNNQSKEEREQYLKDTLVDLKDLVGELERLDVTQGHWNILAGFIKSTLKSFDPIITYIKNNRS